MKISFYYRRQSDNAFSIENLFAAIRAAMPMNVDYKVIKSRFQSHGLFKRLYNIFEAYFNQGDINHITGDVHYLAYFLKKNKTVLTIHDCVMLEKLTGLKQKIFLILWYWLPIKRSTLITVISESTRLELLRYLKIDEKKIKVIHNCVSPAFEPSPKIWNKTKPVILQIGTKENKNIPRVAESLIGIKCHFRIIGKLSNEQRNVLEKKQIEYTSAAGISDEHLGKEYRDADMVVFVSTYEGFGLPIIEAQATGRPVVTSNFLSMPEVAGDAACLVDPYKTSSIRGGILKIMNNKIYREKLIALGYKNVERFRPECIAVDYLKVYKEILQSSLKKH